MGFEEACDEPAVVGERLMVREQVFKHCFDEAGADSGTAQARLDNSVADDCSCSEPPIFDPAHDFAGDNALVSVLGGVVPKGQIVQAHAFSGGVVSSGLLNIGELAEQGRLVVHTDKPLGRLAIDEQDHRGDRSDLKSMRGQRVSVDIELGDGQVGGSLLRNLVQDRRDDAAGSAPGGPEIHQNWAVVG
jgi:hypothetical protein